MANPSPGYSLTLRVETPATYTATSELAAAVGAADVAEAVATAARNSTK